MKLYLWSVWKSCKFAGHVNAYSQWEALRKADTQFGRDTFIVMVGPAEDCPEKTDRKKSNSSISMAN